MFFQIKRIRLAKKNLKGHETILQRKTKRFFVTNALFAFWRVACGVRVNKSKLNIRLLMALDSHNDGSMSSTVHLIIKRKLCEPLFNHVILRLRKGCNFSFTKQEVRDLVVFQAF